MIIYLDFLLLFNMCMNIVVLYLSSHFNKIRTKWVKMIFSALIGSGLSIIALLHLNTVAQNFIKIILPVIMCKIYLQHTSLKMNMKFLTTYYMFAFICSGAMLWIKHTVVSSGVSTIKIVSVMLFFTFVICVYKYIAVFFTKSFRSNKSYHEVTLCHNNVTLTLTGFNDTGNSLTSDTIGLPIYICDMDALKPILASTVIRYKQIACQTILQDGNINTFIPDSLFVDGKKTNAIIGISPKPLNAEYDILLNLENSNLNETEKKQCLKI